MDEMTNLEKKNYLISRKYKSFNLVLKTWKVAIKLQIDLKSHKLESRQLSTSLALGQLIPLPLNLYLILVCVGIHLSFQRAIFVHSPLPHFYPFTNISLVLVNCKYTLQAEDAFGLARTKNLENTSTCIPWKAMNFHH